MTEHNLNRMGGDFWGPSGTPDGLRPAAPGGKRSGGSPAKSDGTPPRADGGRGDSGFTGDAASSTGDDRGPAQPPPPPPPERVEDLLAELDGYIGLGAVKKEVKSLVNLVTVHRLRKDNDLPNTDLSLHLVFSGNPGTGKTTVARIMARVYHSLGILSKGQLVEVDRSGLVAGYVGQTALKTSQVISAALGGVLFVDEAYALNGRAENDFGQEAIDTLLKAMEDHRDDLVVIAAGYDGLMDDFIHSNPGLESRFNRFLHFEDYSGGELLEIFEAQCKKGCYELDGAAREQVAALIAENRDDPIAFGNARGVRNLFEQVLVHQANRLAGLETVSREDLMRLTGNDVLAARGLEPAVRPPEEPVPDRPNIPAEPASPVSPD